MLDKTEGTIKNGQSIENNNIGYTRHKTKTNKQKTQHRKLTKMDNTDPTNNWG